MALISLISIIQITDPPKILVSSFPGVDRNGISVSAIMKKLKKGSHFVNIDCSRKISNYWTPAKVWVSGFPAVNGNRISAVWPLWKNWKMALILLISIIQKNFKLLTPPQSLGLWFSRLSTEMEYQLSGHYEKIEKRLSFR